MNHSERVATAKALLSAAKALAAYSVSSQDRKQAKALLPEGAANDFRTMGRVINRLRPGDVITAYVFTMDDIMPMHFKVTDTDSFEGEVGLLVLVKGKSMLERRFDVVVWDTDDKLVYATTEDAISPKGYGPNARQVAGLIKGEHELREEHGTGNEQ